MTISMMHYGKAKQPPEPAATDMTTPLPEWVSTLPEHPDGPPVTLRVAQARLRELEAMQLQGPRSNPLVLGTPDPVEEQKAFEAEQVIRAAQLEEHVRRELRAVKRQRTQDDAVDDRIDAQLADERDERLAQSQYQRVTDPRLHLVDLFRERRRTMKATAFMVGAGIFWTTINVHNNIVGASFPAWDQPGAVLEWFGAFVVEPLAAIPFLLLMRAMLTGAAYGDSKWLRTKSMIALEAVALLASLGLNSFPYLPVVGVWQGAGVFLAHSVAPLMIVLAVVTHEVLARLYTRRMAEAAEQCRRAENIRAAGEDSRKLTEAMVEIELATARGEIKLMPDGYPPMNQLLKPGQFLYSKATLTTARNTLVALKEIRMPEQETAETKSA